MTLILQVFYSVISGLILALAIPNELILWGSPVLAFVAIIPLYLAYKSCKTFTQAWLNALIQGLTVHLISSFWLCYFKDFAIFTYGASAFGSCMVASFYGVFYYLPYYRTKNNPLSAFSLTKHFYEYPSFRVLWFASVYVVFEWSKSVGFIGYPWGTVFSAMYKFTLIRQIADFTGVYGITFLAVLFSCLLAEGASLWLNQDKANKKKEYYEDFLQAAAIFAVLFVSALVYGDIQYNKVRTPVKTLNTVLVQQNSDPWKDPSDTATILASEELTTQGIEKFKQINEDPELVVWSEGVLNRSFPNGANHYKKTPDEYPLCDYIRDNNTPFLIGGSYCRVTKDKKRTYFNSAIIFDKDGEFRGHYAKLHLVPFAESIPGMDNPFIRELIMKIVHISAGWSKGDQLTYFDILGSWYYPEGEDPDSFDEVIEPVKNIDISIPYSVAFNIEKPTVRIATPICFDDSFTDVIRPMFLNGAELFVNLTDDSWSLKNSSEIQHFVIASYRPIEYRSSFVRSTNAGYSVVLDPAGRVLCDQPLFQESTAAYKVPVYKRNFTIYARLGNWLPYTFILFMIGVTITMVLNFEVSDYIPSERKKQLSVVKTKKSKKQNKTDKKEKHNKHSKKSKTEKKSKKNKK